jgi:hypothetical protein
MYCLNLCHICLRLKYRRAKFSKGRTISHAGLNTPDTPTLEKDTPSLGQYRFEITDPLQRQNTNPFPTLQSLDNLHRRWQVVRASSQRSSCLLNVHPVFSEATKGHSIPSKQGRNIILVKSNRAPILCHPFFFDHDLLYTSSCRANCITDIF